MNSVVTQIFQLLIGNEKLLRGLWNGIDQGEYVYQRGDVLVGKGDPLVTIKIESESMILTQAKETGIWLRKPAGSPDGNGDDKPPNTGKLQGITQSQDAEIEPDMINYEGILWEDLLEIWQIPSPASPQLRSAKRLTKLQARNLKLIQHRVLKRLKESGIEIVISADNGVAGYALSEDLALALGLLFRALVPVRGRTNMRAIVEGVDAMS